MDRLTDDNNEVIHDALGSIDALILKTGESLCKELYRKNILVLLDMILHKVFTSLCRAKIVSHRSIEDNGTKSQKATVEIYWLAFGSILPCIEPYMVPLQKIVLMGSEQCDEAAEAIIKLKLYLRTLDILLQLPQLPVHLKSSIGTELDRKR